MPVINFTEGKEHVLNSNIVSDMYKVVEPQTSKEFEAYFLLRWECLRAPWDKPIGSEKDELEESSIHAVLLDKHRIAIGVARLHQLSNNSGQIRYMGIKATHRSKRLGGLLLEYLEARAKELGWKKLELHAREEALNFYKRNNYKLVDKSYLMWDKIQHYLMEKLL